MTSKPHSVPELVAQMRERVDTMQAHADSPEMVAALSDVLASFEAVVPLLLRQKELEEQLESLNVAAVEALTAWHNLRNMTEPMTKLAVASNPASVPE